MPLSVVQSEQALIHEELERLRQEALLAELARQRMYDRTHIVKRHGIRVVMED